VLYLPSDILSGDFYSLYSREDGQGHGVSPALTVFAVSATMHQLIHRVANLNELVKHLFPTVKTFLGEIEQLSYTMIMISPDGKSLSYVSGGMYPFLIKKGDTLIEMKVNNIPFMNFSELPIVSEVEIEGWKSLMLYSDGLIEHVNRELNGLTPEALITDPSRIERAIETMRFRKFEDDVTLVYLENIKERKNDD